MQRTPETLLRHLENYLSKYFGDRKYFACVYGSYSNGKRNNESDVDVLVATADFTSEDLENIKQFVIDFHKKNGLKLDNEVPFDNKLIISYSELREAIELKAFSFKKGTFEVPKVIKNKEFLTSHEVKMRLALNALTSPHIFSGNDKDTYYKLKANAEKNIVLFAINKQISQIFKKEELLQSLLFGETGESGEMYLGYKEYPIVVKYLKEIIDRELELLKINSYVTLNNGKIEVIKNVVDFIKPKQRIFIGVAWPYVNGNLHVGHVAGYLLPADITARLFRLLGNDVLMVSGSDCFGTPITVEADRKGVSPQEIVDIYHKRNIQLFENLELSFDLYTKTATENHRKITQDFLRAFWENGLLKVKSQPQYYSPTSNKFLPDRYVEGTCPNCGFKESRSDQCDSCGSLLDQNLINPVSKIDRSRVILKETQHLFILWDKLQMKIETYVDSKPGWRNWVKNETKKWLDNGLIPRAVTRDLDWGVEIPRDIATNLENTESKRIYVWFDAVIGYYSASVEWAKQKNLDWKAFWYGDNLKHYYFMGKDNLVFHTIFWPGQLMVYDSKLHLPDFPAINQYLNLEGSKFSKSRGIVVDTAEFIEKYGSDALRFYLTTIMPENSDTSFSWKDFFEKNNSLLVGHFGNYIHRTLSLYKDEKIGSKVSEAIINRCEVALKNSGEYIKRSEFKNYYSEIESLAKYANKYFDRCEPWITKKIDKIKFLSNGPDLIILTYVIACLLEPITPKAVHRYFEFVGIKENLCWKNIDNLGEFLENQISMIRIGNPKPLYQKFEVITLSD